MRKEKDVRKGFVTTVAAVPAIADDEKEWETLSEQQTTDSQHCCKTVDGGSGI